MRLRDHDVVGGFLRQEEDRSAIVRHSMMIRCCVEVLFLEA